MSDCEACEGNVAAGKHCHACGLQGPAGQGLAFAGGRPRPLKLVQGEGQGSGIGSTVKFRISCELWAMPPDVDMGLLTKLDVRIDNEEEDEEEFTEIGRAHVMLIHKGTAMNLSEPLDDACDADSQTALDLYSALFDGDGEYKGPLEDCMPAGTIVFVAGVELGPRDTGRGIEAWLMRRLEQSVSEDSHLLVADSHGLDAAAIEQCHALGFGVIGGHFLWLDLTLVDKPLFPIAPRRPA